MIENKNYYISQINSSKAYQFTSYYHYSGVGFKKAILNLGVFRKKDNLLVGCLQWGCSYQEKIKLDRYVKEPIAKKDYLELNRFCMADSEGANAESQGISLGVKWIKKNRPDIKLLVSYSGRKEGNYGYIYQATNWEYLGYFTSPGFWSVDGKEKHLVTLWTEKSKYGTGFKNIPEYLESKYEDIRQTWSKQLIYIIRLDKTLTPATPPQDYPKADTIGSIVDKVRIYKQNDEVFNRKIERKNEIPIFYYEKEKFLFTKKTLIRRGDLQGDRRNIIMYDDAGKFEKIYASMKEIKADGYAQTYVKKALENLVMYKHKYFVYMEIGEDYSEEIDIPFVCIVDEIPFSTLIDAAAYLGVSKQAVQQSRAREGKKISGKEIIWGE